MNMRSPHNFMCPYTNLELHIKGIEHMNMRGWKHKSAMAKEYYVVKACVDNYEALFVKFDEIQAGGSNKGITPEVYMWFLCQRALEVNPHFADAVGVRAYKDVVGAKVKRIQQEKEKPTMMTPKDMRRLGIQRASTAASPEDQWHIAAELCERQDRMLALLERQTDLMELMFKILDQPLNCYTKPEPNS